MGRPVLMWSPPPTVPSSNLGGPFPTQSRKLGFFERMRIGWRLTKISLGILRKEKGLIVLPFLSRSEEHTSELQSQSNLVCRLLLEKKQSRLCELEPHVERSTRR